jgi:pSer/pThr/pTyr-binding forkhead associated (FHA) protein
MADVPVLVCTGGALQGAVIEVPEGGLTIGRAEENDVVLEDDGVSRYHARILFDNGSLWLQDAGSRNGVFANDVRVTGHQALKVGDVLRIGEHLFQVRWEDPDDETITGRRPKELGGDAEKPGGKRWWWPFG